MPEDYTLHEPVNPHSTPNSAKQRGPFYVKFAGFWLRLIAGLLDYIIPSAILNQIFGGFSALPFFIWLMFNTVFMAGRTGRSLGKQMLGIRVCRIMRSETGDHLDYYLNPSPGLCFWRLVAHILDIAPFFGGFIRVAFNRDRKTFADSICRTVVVKSDRRLTLWTLDEVRANESALM